MRVLIQCEWTEWTEKVTLTVMDGFEAGEIRLCTIKLE